MVNLSRRSVIAASMLAALAGGVESGQAQRASAVAPVPPEGVMPLFLSEGRVIMLLRSKGRTPFPVVFDTGTNGNALDTRVATQLGLKKLQGKEHKVIDGSTGKGFVTFGAVLPEIAVQDYRLGDLEVSVYDWNKPSEVGIFGPNMFENRLVYIDLSKSRLRVRANDVSARPLTGRHGYINNLPAAEISLPDVGIVAAKLDSGNNAPLLLPESYISRVKLKTKPEIVGRTTSVSGTRDVLGGTLDGEVKIGGLTLSGLDVIFVGLLPNVGLPILRRLKLLIDPAAQACWLLTRQDTGPNDLKGYTGKYKHLSVRVENEVLIYQKEGRPPHRLHYLCGDLFEIGSTGQEVDFRREDEKIVSMRIVTNDYQWVEVDRTA